MDAASRETRAGLPWDMLYADDLMRMASSREELKRKLQSWRGSLVAKGLKANTRNSKDTVSDGVSGMTEETDVWQCVVCGNSIQCTGGQKWIHKKYHGVRGSLLAVSTIFECQWCKGELTFTEVEADVVAEGGAFEVVEKFCYMGYMVSRRGGVDAVERQRSAWVKFQELSPFLTSKKTAIKMKGHVF
jgi:hypothetical protein